MFRANQIIILSLIITINVTLVATEKFDIVFPADFKEQDTTLLKSITSQQALPLMLFKNEKPNDPLVIPTGLIQAEINDGRLTSGTDFYALSSLNKHEKIYFCPASIVGVRDNCLTPMEFGMSQVLECEIEPTPLIYKNSSFENCGPDGIGIPLKMVYKICRAQEPYSYSTTNIIMFTFCYDRSSERILFVSYRTTLAKLLTENLLSYPAYEFQKMAYPKHFALATWRKSTYHYVNVALQHKQLVGLWNEINDYIGANATEMYFEPRSIRTGVVDIPADQLSNTEVDGQMYNIWYTMVADFDHRPYTGVVILMNNFITTNVRLRRYIDTFCEEKDFCVRNLKQRFDEIGGRVRCCKITEKISRFFQLANVIMSVNEVMRIRNITYTVYNGRMITDIDD